MVLRDGVESIQHFNEHKYGQTQGARLYLSFHEILARVLGEIKAFNEVINLEILPVRAVSPVHELVEGDEGVAIGGSLIVDVPVDEDSNSSEADVEANNRVTEVSPVGNQAVIGFSWRLFHDVFIGGVESKGSGGWAVSHQVNPEELHRVEAFRDAEHGGEEDREDLTDVTGDEVSNEGLHVTVDGAAFFNSLYNSSKVVVVENHVRSALGNLSSGNSHCNTDTRLLDGGGIVDTITSHSDDFAHVD